eukprot:Gb_13238 [translate_table: standard]
MIPFSVPFMNGGMEWVKAKKNRQAMASDKPPLSITFTSFTCLVLLFGATLFIIQRWTEKVRAGIPLHILTWEDICPLLAIIASLTYLLGFFCVVYVQTIRANNLDEATFGDQDVPAAAAANEAAGLPLRLNGKAIHENCDEDIALAVSNGSLASHSLESGLGDCNRAVAVRRRSVELKTGRSLEGLPFEGIDYKSILGQCCEMPVGYVQIPVGVVGPLLVNGMEYMVPMATTQRGLVASTNRGCKAILLSGGATSILLKDGITRAPVIRFSTIRRTAEVKFYLENPTNFRTLSKHFESTSNYAKLQGIQCIMAGRNLYVRFRCSTGDAMGMNMVSKGAENVLAYLKDIFQDMDVISLSGNCCADKKATAMNWIEGRGKSVVCEAVIQEEVVAKVLKTSVSSLLELNTINNLVGSAMAGVIGGFNARATSIVSAIFIATGQDPAQNVESSQCMTMMEVVNGKDLHIYVTMPSIEVGTIGGGTKLSSQAAGLNMLGVKGPDQNSPGSNSRCLANIVAATVLAAELSVMPTLAACDLSAVVKNNTSLSRGTIFLSKGYPQIV